MHSHHKNFNRYLENKKQKNETASFEGYLKANKKYVLQFLVKGTKDEFSLWYGMFLQSAKVTETKVEKGDAEAVWETLTADKNQSSMSLKLDFKDKLVICNDYGPASIHLKEWMIDGVDVRKKILDKRTEVVKLVEQEKPVKESDYLLLSCVVYLPSSRNSFVIEVEDKVFKKIRRSAIQLPSVKFSADLMKDFFCYKQKLDEEREEGKDEDEEDEEDEEKDDEDDEDDEDEDDADDALDKIKKKCKKNKDEEGLALVAVARQFMENKNWAQSTTEESFIDQHLLPIVRTVFLNDPNFVYSRSTGRIPLNDSSLSESKGRDTCLMLKPDFCIMHDFRGDFVGLLAIEVKLPNAASSQTLSDRSKLGLELKRLVDQQVIKGSLEPKSFGVLVEGFECTVFSCCLEKSGCYLFVEVEKLWLLRSCNDMMLVPDLVRVFLRVKAAMTEAIGRLYKKPKAEGSTSLRGLVKQTVGLPTHKNPSCI